MDHPPTRNVKFSHPVTIFYKQTIENYMQTISQVNNYHYMDDILLSDQNKDSLAMLFEEVKIVLPKWGLQNAPEKIQRGDSVNYLGYKIGLQRNRTQKAQIRRDWLQTLNDF